MSKGVLLLLQWRKKHRDSLRSFSERESDVRVKQTGRSCTACRDDRCILLALFLLPAVGPEDIEEFSHGAFQENAEVSLFPTALFYLQYHLSNTDFQETSFCEFRECFSKNQGTKALQTSCQEAQSLLLLCRLEAAASDVLQCLQALFPTAVWDGVTLSKWDSVLDGSSPCSPIS